jgi:glycosidase
MLNPFYIFKVGDFELASKRISNLISGDKKSLLKIYQSLIFLLKGTPFLLYGDELEFKTGDKLMKWDNSPNCGFSSNSTALNVDCEKNVKLQKATGAGKTLSRLYKTMSDLRKEPSFQWGQIEFPKKEENLILFKREAEDFDSYIIAANTGKETKNVDFKDLFNLKNEKGNVSYFFSLENNNHEFAVDSEIILDNILLKFGELLVVKCTKL